MNTQTQAEHRGANIESAAPNRAISQRPSMLAWAAQSAIALLMLALLLLQSGQARATDLDSAWRTRSLPVSAHTAQRLHERGAQFLDVRSGAAFEAAHIPGAVSLPQLLNAQGDALAALLGQAGIDSSREFVIVSQPGDAAAMALHARLAERVAGSVHWLVGGVEEWRMGGRVVASGPTRAAHLPVPQVLVAFEGQSAAAAAPRMAAASRRDVRAEALFFAPVRFAAQ
jgi:rhodanese-related sulfurtransferase